MSQPEKMESTSANIAEEQTAKLKALFPEVFTESGKIDFDRLKLTLGETVDVGKERYGMNWPGKAECFKTIQKPSAATLVPAREESVNFDTTENLIIEGDNLEVLKLLQKSYFGRVKMIYIDPPYNTGNEFIYPDDFSETLDTYLRYTGQVDTEGRKFSTNTEADGRFHSKWLNMMYPRLFLARNLLRDDGVIFISIDDHEADNLKKLCNEVFGEENFIANVIWQKVFAPKNTARHFSEDHDYLLCYARNADVWAPELLPRSESALERYANPDDDPRGPWSSSDMTARNYYGDGLYSVTSKGGKVFKPSVGNYWRVKFSKFQEMDKDNRIWWGEDGDSMPRLKRFLSEVKAGVVPQTLWKFEEVGHTQEAKKELIQRVGFQNTNNVIDSVKPTRLLRKCLRIGTTSEGEDIVLDFFAGTGTTAHAVLLQNKDDQGNRKFICVQLPEPLPEPEPGLRTIADAAKKRVRSFIDECATGEVNQLSLAEKGKPDYGFKVFKLQSSNFRAWNAAQPKDAEQLGQQLEMHVQHIEAGRTQDDILYEILLKSGFPLTTKIESITMAGKPVFSVADGALLICLERPLTPEVIKAMADRKPERVVCLDDGFAGNDQLKTNAVQTMKAKGVTSFRTV